MISIISILYLFVFVIIYNFTKGHNTSLPRGAPLVLGIIPFSVRYLIVFVVNVKWGKNKIQNTMNLCLI